MSEVRYTTLGAFGPEQRSEAFLLGYDYGAPANCINSYWPGVTA